MHSDYNVRPHGGIAGRTPLSAFEDDAAAGDITFLASRNQAYLPGAWSGDAVLCLSSPRAISGSVQRTSSAGTMDFVLDSAQLPTAAGPTSAVAGESWHFQAWHLDGSVGGLTNAVTITYR